MTGRAASDARLRAAEAFLQEAVYRSRGAQAGAALLAANDPEAGRCGLGERAAVALDLTPRAEELLAELWPAGLADASVEGVRAAMTAWIGRQDALDRKRNHFLRDFRGAHGFDRAAYTSEQEAAYRAGLDAINGEVDAARRAAATALLAAG